MRWQGTYWPKNWQTLSTVSLQGHSEDQRASPWFPWPSEHLLRAENQNFQFSAENWKGPLLGLPYVLETLGPIRHSEGWGSLSQPIYPSERLWGEALGVILWDTDGGWLNIVGIVMEGVRCDAPQSLASVPLDPSQICHSICLCISCVKTTSELK